MSPTTSLSKDRTDVTKAASLLLVQASQADVVVEGTVNVTTQTWYMPSPAEAMDLLPFTFATPIRNAREPQPIVGGVVQIILANDAPTPNDDTAVAFNVLELNTNISSLRVRAATRAGNPRRDPFPYKITVRELNDLGIDAVAASSFPMVFNVGGAISLNSALVTAGGVAFHAGRDLTLNAPVQTTLGQITMEGDSLFLYNAITVTQAPVDDQQNDILLTARSGDVVVNSTVKAVNRIRLVQRNRTNPFLAVRDYVGADVPIVDGGVARAVIDLKEAADNFTFENLQVKINITHTWDSDLTGTLVAPNGTRIILFENIGGSGDNFTDTIFDSQVPQSISSGTAPFTGSFRPRESLLPLTGLNALGQWQLEVRDSGGGDVGSVTGFQLLFSNTSRQEGSIYGVGTVACDSLDILAEGFVGNADRFPSDPGFFLGTDVNSLTARVGKSISIDERDRLVVTSLIAGGLATIRVGGYDDPLSREAFKAALKATISEVGGLDVSAPNGSIDVKVYTSSDLTLGNAAAIRQNAGLNGLAAGHVSIRTTGGSNAGQITVLDGPRAGSGARTVKGIYNERLDGVYAPETPFVFASTIEGNQPGALSVPGIPTLRLGDRILVAGGVRVDPVAGQSIANGIYSVTRVGSGSTKWLLTRATDSDTQAEMPTNVYVKVAGDVNPMRVYQLAYAVTESMAFARTFISVQDQSVLTDIGSDDPNDEVVFVVSSNIGNNNAGGSLGKMIMLATTNSPTQTARLAFSVDVGTIQLQQELPAITRQLVIDGNERFGTMVSPPQIVIDGTRITSTADGTSTDVNTSVSGLRFTGSGARGSRVSNLFVGGFVAGAGVAVDNSDMILIDAVTLGKSPGGNKLSCKYGIEVVDSLWVTVSNSTIDSCTVAGVRATGTTSSMILVGNTIGQFGLDNAIGVQLAASGQNRLGLDRVATTTATATKDSSVLQMAAGFDFDNIYLGQAVRGVGFAAGANVVDINPAASRLTLSMPVTVSGDVAPTFVAPNRNTIQWNLVGVEVARGNNQMLATTVINNVRKGVSVTGGTNTIGNSSTRSVLSNQIYANRGWGILVEGATNALALNLAAQQVIQGNYFVDPTVAVGAPTTQNRPGAIGVMPGQQRQATEVFVGNGSIYDANATTGVDAQGNQHIVVADVTAPLLTVLTPLDVLGSAVPSVLQTNGVAVNGSSARSVKTFVLEFSDNGIGIDKATIDKNSFTLSLGAAVLREGTDYTFRFSGNDQIQFDALPAAGVFAIGSYTLTATSSAGTLNSGGGFSGGKLTDRANNLLQSNQVNGTTKFTITLADIPGIVTGLATRVSDGKIDLTWTAPTVLNVPITDYLVEYSVNSSPFDWQIFSHVPSSVAAASVDGLTNGVSYVFRVAAINAVGNGTSSAPSGSAVPRSLPSSSVSLQAFRGAAQAVLTWTKPLSDGGSAILDYVVQSRSDGGAPWTVFADGVSPATGATVTGLTNGNAYVFRVAATTAAGQGDWTAASAPAVTPAVEASVPRNLQAIADNTLADLTWEAPVSNGGAAISDYQVEARTNQGQWAIVLDGVNSATGATIRGLSNASSYEFRVRALNAVGLGVPSNISAAITPRDLPTAPQGLLAAASNARVSLAWSAPVSSGSAAIIDYAVQRRADGGTIWQDVTKSVSATTGFTDTGVINGTSYVFRVAAVTSVGQGAWTVASPPATPFGLASIPLNVQVNVQGGQAVVTWLEPSSNGGAAIVDYLVQSSTNGGRTWTTFADGVSSTTRATVPGLNNGTSYSFRVAAVTTLAPIGTFSAWTVATISMAVPGAVTGLAATAGTSFVTLVWTAPATNGGSPVTDYALEYRAVGSAQWILWNHAPSAVTRAVITGLVRGTGYNFRVTAVTGFGQGAGTETLTAVVPMLPPTRLTGRALNGSVSLGWVAPRLPARTRILDYTIQYSTDSGVTWTTVSRSASTAARASVAGLTNGTFYIFRVAAVTTAGVGSFSANSARLRPFGPIRR